jgi:hypothetical protein
MLLAAGKVACRMSGTTKSAAVELDLVTTLYGDPADVKPLGEQFLRHTRSTASACLLRLRADGDISRALQSRCPQQILSAVERSCRDDFRQGRFHCIDGWVLSQTELDIAALAAA